MKRTTTNTGVTRSQGVSVAPRMDRREMLALSVATGLVLTPGADVKAALESRVDATEVSRYPQDVVLHGAAGDGRTDDTQAILSAIRDAALGQGFAETGGLVIFPAGTFLVSQPLVIPNKVKLLGQGSRSTILRAARAFPANAAVVELGSASNVFDCSIDRLQIDCAGHPGSIGVYSGFANEQCGVYNCVIRNFRDFGVRFDRMTGAAAVEVYRTELYGSDQGFSGGIFCSQTSCMLSVHDVTIAGALSRVSGNCGISMDSGHLIARTLHCETVKTGVTLGMNASCVIIGMSGHPTIEDLVHIAPTSNGNITIMGLRQNGATIGIRDERTGRNVSMPGQIGLYAMGSGSGPAGGHDKFVLSDVVGPDGWWNVRTAVGQAMVDPLPDSEDRPSVGSGNVFRTINSRLTRITNLSDGRQGQRVRIIFGDSNTELFGRHFSLQGGFRSNQGSTIELVLNGETWVELNRAMSREDLRYSVTGSVAIRRLDADRATLPEVTAVLATLIKDLQSRGLLQ